MMEEKVVIKTRRVGNTWNYQELIACQSCGKLRWVNRYTHGDICRACSAKARRQQFDIDRAIHLYFNEEMSVIEVSKQLRVNETVIRRRFKEVGLACRTRSENGKLASQKGKLPVMSAKDGMCWNWKGGRYTTPEGYIKVKAEGHPRANQQGYILEHILVLEEKLGRPLMPDEIGHHINGIKDDNRPENLVTLSRKKHHFNLLSQARAERIKELENKNKLLQEALDNYIRKELELWG